MKRVTVSDIGDEDFYVVWTPSGSAPQVIHGFQSEAEAEAERLAAANPGRKFYVLHGISHSEVSPNPVKTTELSARCPF